MLKDWACFLRSYVGKVNLTICNNGKQKPCQGIWIILKITCWFNKENIHPFQHPYFVSIFNQYGTIGTQKPEEPQFWLQKLVIVYRPTVLKTKTELLKSCWLWIGSHYMPRNTQATNDFLRNLLIFSKHFIRCIPWRNWFVSAGDI